MSHLNEVKNIRAAILKAENRVCSTYNITRDAITNRSKSRARAQARFAVWFILNVMENVPVAVISRIYEYDPATIVNGLFRARELGIPEELGYEKELGTIPVQYVDKSAFSGDKKEEKNVGKVIRNSSPGYPQTIPRKARSPA